MAFAHRRCGIEFVMQDQRQVAFACGCSHGGELVTVEFHHHFWRYHFAASIDLGRVVHRHLSDGAIAGRSRGLHEGIDGIGRAGNESATLGAYQPDDPIEIGLGQRHHVGGEPAPARGHQRAQYPGLAQDRHDVLVAHTLVVLGVGVDIIKLMCALA